MASLYIGNSNVVELEDLKNSATNNIDTGASVQVTVLDEQEAEVTGQVWPVLMSHVSNGLYRATLDPAINLVAGTVFFLKVEATGSGGQTGLWKYKVIAQERNCK